MPTEAPSSKDRLVRTLRLDDERIAAILEKLDTGPEHGDAGRRALRYRYRVKGLVIHMQQPGFSTPVPFLVPTRNISASGLSFLHGGFVHKGTRCLVQLITTYGTWANVTASVVRCRFLEGNVHEVAIKFDQEVNPAVYCSAAVQSRVLLAEDEPMQAKLAVFHLQQLNAEVQQAQNGKQAVEMAMKEPFDLILMDMDMPVMNGFDAVAELRRKGYTGTIIAATGLTRPEDRQRCLDAGCDSYLPKPYVRADLAAVIQSLHEEPLFSSFHDDAGMADLLHAFVAELSGRARLVEAAYSENDVEKLKRLIRSFKSEGSTYGFDIISEIAGRIEIALFSDPKTGDLRKDVEKLVRLCGQARAPVKKKPATVSTLGAATGPAKGAAESKSPEPADGQGSAH